MSSCCTELVLQDEVLQQNEMPPPPIGAYVQLSSRSFRVKDIMVQYQDGRMYSRVLLREVGPKNVDYSLGRRRKVQQLQVLTNKLKAGEIPAVTLPEALQELSRLAVELR